MDNFGQNMVQFSTWTNCCNHCDFCLLRYKNDYTKQQQIYWLNKIKENILTIDWEHQFSCGISLLGGELYFIKDKDVQDTFMSLIDVIIEKILKVSKNPCCRYSTVTNGLYEPSFLYRVIDRIKDTVGMKYVDLNFSYDLKYRYKSEEDRLKVLKNINDFHKKYDYDVGVQMILTQNVINLWKEGKFDVNKFIEEDIPGNNLCFLYPHPVNTGKYLDDFFFKRKDFLDFLQYLRNECHDVYYNFIYSTKNSGTFKYTGYKDRFGNAGEESQQPTLTDGKEIITDCGHSELYRCYADSDKCILCDIENIEGSM